MSAIMQRESTTAPDGEIMVSFGYRCTANTLAPREVPGGSEIRPRFKLPKTSSFSCLSGAALSANATLANTNICNGVIGSEILPSLDSPRSFHKVASSPSLSRLDILSPSLQRSMSNLSCGSSSPSPPDADSYLYKTMSAPSQSQGFLSTMEVQMAGGAAGEDRVQAVCSEEKGWLFCAIYDGFNGRDAADYLAGTLYETMAYRFELWDSELKEETVSTSDNHEKFLLGKVSFGNGLLGNPQDENVGSFPESFRQGVCNSLLRAVLQAENDFLHMVEQEMEERPDLVSVGSCVLIVLLVGEDLYALNLGDSRAVLATYGETDSLGLKAIQLTDNHTVDNEVEKARVIGEHPDDPMTVVAGKVKGKLKVTRALGVGYLKKKTLNDALMGILRVRNLVSPPYISTEPSLTVHRITKADSFIIVASDGLFDFFSNKEAVRLVQSYILRNPSGDPAKFLLEQLMVRAADRAGFTMEELMNIPAGRRRKYHDDVTVMVIILGTNKRTSKASTCM